MRGLPLRNFCDKRKLSSSLELLSEAKISQDIILRNFCNKREQNEFIRLCRAKQKSRICFANAEIAQLVEHNLAKVGVAGSSPVFRSTFQKSLRRW